MSARKTYIAFISCVGILTASPAIAVQTVESIRPSLIEALQNGESHGIMGGNTTDMMKRLFGTSAPLYFDMKRIQNLPEAGCGVVEVFAHQEGVKEPPADAKLDALPKMAIPPANKFLKLNMRYCTDGHVPRPENVKDPRVGKATP